MWINMKETYTLIARNASGKTVSTTNPAQWWLCVRLRLGATSQLLQFGRVHPSHFYQLWAMVPRLWPAGAMVPRLWPAVAMVPRLWPAVAMVPRLWGGAANKKYSHAELEFLDRFNHVVF